MTKGFAVASTGSSAGIEGNKLSVEYSKFVYNK
jgi:hypothetical protein